MLHLGARPRGRGAAGLRRTRHRIRALVTAWSRFLTGTVGHCESFSDIDIRSRFPRFIPEALEANQPIVDLVQEIADRNGATPGQIALAWLLAKSPNIVPIPGSRRPERVRENIAAADVTLSSDEVEEIDTRSAQLTVIGARGSGHEDYG